MSSAEVRSRPGVQPRPVEVSSRSLGARFSELKFNSRRMLAWLLRGHPATSPLIPVTVRRAVLRLGGVKLGPNIHGLERCWFDSAQVSIGEGSYLNIGCTFEGQGRVVLGRDVGLGPEVMIVTSYHEISSERHVARDATFLEVRIEDGCWIGARAVILPGVTIGEGTIIGAGSVVTKDCEPGAVYVGVPARRVR